MPVCELEMKRRVEFNETDRVGMIHFSNYFKYLDTAVGEFFRSLGLPGPLTLYWGGTGENELDWPYVTVTCDFVKPAQFDDLVRVRLGVSKIGNKSLTFEVRFDKDGVEYARGRAVVVCSRGIQGQPKTLPIPPEIRERLALAPWCLAEEGSG